MLHEMDVGKAGAMGPAMARAVEACVHCGFCLAACPTYRELGQEMDSPRGRIVLMKEVMEGRLTAEAARPHVDRCLGCLACEPACPSGVPYRDLISPYRATVGAGVATSGWDAVRRALMRWTLPYPGRFRWAARLAGMGRAFRALMPSALRPMLELVPGRLPSAVALPERTPARGARRARVALLAGCAQQVLDPDINVATIDVLARNGVEVWVPRGQGCCGALSWHTGDLAGARGFARRNLEAFGGAVDAVLTNAAGCGSAMHEYPLVLAGTADEGRARELAGRTTDVSVFLARLGLMERPAGWREPVRVAYHDACHLANAQGVRTEPRSLLASIPGLELVEVPDAHLCCGSAGTYNVEQPTTASALGRQKVTAIRGTGTRVVASGNIGCLTQLRLHGAGLEVRHTMQVLRDAYEGRTPGDGRAAR